MDARDGSTGFDLAVVVDWSRRIGFDWNARFRDRDPTCRRQRPVARNAVDAGDRNSALRLRNGFSPDCRGPGQFRLASSGGVGFSDGRSCHEPDDDGCDSETIRLASAGHLSWDAGRGSFLAAYLFDWVLSATVAAGDAHNHHHQNWWSTLSAIVVLLLIAQISSRRFFAPAQVRGESTKEISVNGMHCGSCVSRIETAVGKMSGVDSIQVDLNRGVASINGDASVADVVSLIEGLGFEVVKGSKEKQ